MSEVIVAQIIIGLVSLAGTIITVVSGSKKTDWRIEQLEKKVEKHNNIIERVYKLEQAVEDIKS